MPSDVTLRSIGQIEHFRDLSSTVDSGCVARESRVVQSKSLKRAVKRMTLLKWCVCSANSSHAKYCGRVPSAPPSLSSPTSWRTVYSSSSQLEVTKAIPTALHTHTPPTPIRFAHRILEETM